MPALSASNRSQLAYKLEGVYPTNFGVPQGGNGTLLNMNSESLDYTVKTESSKAIRSDRQTPDLVQVSASAQGGFSFEAQYREYDPFIQGALQGDFAAYGTNGVSAAIANLALAAASITAGAAPTGGDAFTTLGKGQWFTIIPDAAASSDVKSYLKGRAFRTSATVATTATVIALDAATPIDTAKAGNSLAGAKISSSVASNGNTMRSYTFEVGHADISQFRQYTGMIPSKMDVKLSVGAIVTGNFDFMGKSFNLLGATSMGSAGSSQTFTPANATRGVFDIFENGQSITATTYIKSADFSIDNTLAAQEAVGVFGNAGIRAGTMKVMGKLEVYFADAVMYRKLLDGVASSLTIPLLDVDGNGYVYFFPRIKYSAAKVATGGLDQDNMLSMDWQALPDTSTGLPYSGKTVVVYRVGA
jgi:hypothetical protein